MARMYFAGVWDEIPGQTEARYLWRMRTDRACCALGRMMARLGLEEAKQRVGGELHGVVVEEEDGRERVIVFA